MEISSNVDVALNLFSRAFTVNPIGASKIHFGEVYKIDPIDNHSIIQRYDFEKYYLIDLPV